MMSTHQPGTRELTMRSHQRFTDVDELARGLTGWDLELHQLEGGGALTAEVSVALAAEAAVGHIRSDRRLHQLGAMPGPHGFALLETGAPSVRWCGQLVTDAALMVFPEGGDFEGVSQAGFDVYALTFADALLAESAEALDLPGLDAVAARGPRVVPCHPNALERVRRIARTLTSPANVGRVANTLRRDGPRALFEALATSRGKQVRSSLSASQQRKMVARATALMRAQLDEPLPVRALVDALGVSWRTLDYGFKCQLGVGPKRYVQTLRLQRARNELRASPGGGSVADAANRWGFWHMGQFAADYRKQFGELPSETLRRA